MKKVLNWLYDYPNLKVYQFQDGFKFSLDSILLAEFAEIRKNDEHIIDLCTGNGVIPILLAHKYQKIVTGVEIQAEIAQLAKESVAYNSMDSMVTILEKGDLFTNVGYSFLWSIFGYIVSAVFYFILIQQNVIVNVKQQLLTRRKEFEEEKQYYQDRQHTPSQKKSNEKEGV